MSTIIAQVVLNADTVEKLPSLKTYPPDNNLKHLAQWSLPGVTIWFRREQLPRLVEIFTSAMTPEETEVFNKRDAAVNEDRT